MPKTPIEGVEPRHEFRTIKLGRSLQRLFSTFPDGWPGFGLLLMRAGIGIALDQIWIAVSLQSSGRDDKWIGILLAVLSAGVAMLGPGAWSIDARMFGRRRFYRDRNQG
jgi:hypothetical protein